MHPMPAHRATTLSKRPGFAVVVRTQAGRLQVWRRTQSQPAADSRGTLWNSSWM